MKQLHVLFLTGAVLAVLTVLALAVGPAAAHRNGCHSHHICPSDHATYRWRGLLCVKPTARERNATFRKRVVYAGLVYYCKR